MQVQKLLAPVAVAILSVAAAAQSTWYVDVAAPAGGNGSSAAPFNTLQQAVSAPAVVTGDTLLVAPGVYLSGAQLSPKGLTIRSTAGAGATEVRLVNGGVGFQCSASGSSPLVTIEGFTISGFAGQTSSGVTGGNVLVRRCVIQGHSDPTGTGAGYGVFSWYDLFLENCTVTNNYVGADAGTFGGVVWSRNSIISGNQSVDLAGVTVLNYSLWNTDYLGTPWTNGNLNAVPRFWNASAGDYRLAPGSPCIDAGNPTLVDPDGSRLDMGAFPFDASYAHPAQAYCTAKQNSLGCTPAISAQGAASASSPSPFLIQCSNQISDRVGFLSYGFQPLALAYQGGWKCVRAPNFRTPPQNSGGAPGGLDCSGVFTFDFNAHVRSGAHATLQPGIIIYAQYWARDPAASFANNRSDAIRFGLGL